VPDDSDHEGVDRHGSLLVDDASIAEEAISQPHPQRVASTV
jgi:hypothetical protein